MLDKYSKIISKTKSFIEKTNPLITNNLIEAHSSYADYIGTKNTSWVKPELILSYFNNQKFSI